jgi:hypothetical protein
MDLGEVANNPNGVMSGLHKWSRRTTGSPTERDKEECGRDGRAEKMQHTNATTSPSPKKKISKKWF